MAKNVQHLKKHDICFIKILAVAALWYIKILLW